MGIAVVMAAAVGQVSEAASMVEAAGTVAAVAAAVA